MAGVAQKMVGGIQKLKSLFGGRKVRNESVFKGAYSKNFWDWIVSPTTIDYQIRTNIYRLRTNARDLALNNPIVVQYLALLGQNVIGPRGMTLQAQVRNNDGALNKTINDKIESGWMEFWKDPWVDGKTDGVTGEQMLIKSVARDGEVFVRKVIDRSLNKFAFALQVIDPDLVDHTYNRPRSEGQNEIRLGIEVNIWGRAVALWVWNSYPQDINSGIPHERIRIEGSEIIHLYLPERANQTRGITWFNSVMISLKHLDGFMEAEVVAARTAACAFPIFEQSDQAETDENAKNFKLDLEPGSGMALPAGLKLSSWDPRHPNIGVLDFVKACLRFFSSGLTVSYNALANDLEGVNYSSIRSGLLVERDRWQVLQEWWIINFRQKIYESWLSCALLSGALVLDSRDPKKFLAVKWTARGWKWVDPLKDVNAAVIAIENMLGSRTAYLAEQGLDIEDICDELKDELRIIKEAGLSTQGAAVAAKDVLKETEEKTGATQAEEIGAAPQGEADAKAAAARRRFRALALDILLEDEEVDSLRAKELLELYREAA